MFILSGSAPWRLPLRLYILFTEPAPCGAMPYFSSAKYLMVRTIWLV